MHRYSPSLIIINTLNTLATRLHVHVCNKGDDTSTSISDMHDAITFYLAITQGSSHLLSCLNRGTR